MISGILKKRAAKTAGATAETLFDTPTANAPAATAEGAAPMTHASLGFDATTDETCIIPWLVPAGWAGQVDIALHWHAAAEEGEEQLRQVRRPDRAALFHPAGGEGWRGGALAV